MTTTTNTTFRNSAVTFVAVMLLALPLAFANASEDDNMAVWDAPNYYPDAPVNYYPDTVTNYYPDTVTNYYPDTVTNYYPDTVSNYYPDTYSYGGSTGYFGGSGYSYGGGLSGSWMLGGGGTVGGGYIGGGHGGTSVWTSNTNINENYCTNGSCNTIFNDNSIFNAPTVVTTDSHNIVTNPAPQSVVYVTQPPVYTPPTYYPPSYYPTTPVCNSCGCPGYQSCSRPITYNAQPYVTLASVPYTGLELGPVGTALYWGFLVLWCLIAAYLIAVKKVQNTLVAWFAGSNKNSHSTHTASTPTTHAHTSQAAPRKTVASAPASQFDGIDPFIQSQINR